MCTLARPAVCGLFVLSLLATGCSKPVGQATGKVTWKGTTVAGAELAFESATTPEESAFGTSRDDGTYFLDYPKNGGLPAGKYKVTITRYTLRNGKPLPGGEEGAALRGDEDKVVQRAYVFEKELVAGANGFDFELTEGKELRQSEQ